MNYNDVRTVLMGIMWIAFFFLPLLIASAKEVSDDSKIFQVFLAIALQLALVLSVGHSWIK